MSWRSGATSWARSSGAGAQPLTSHYETLQLLRALGFPVNPEIAVSTTSTRCTPSAATGTSTATTSPTRSTAWWSRSTTWRCSATARVHVEGAAVGHRLQVRRRRSAPPSCATSRCRSGAPAGRRRSPCSSRCSSAAPPSAWPRCTTRTRCGSRTCGPGDTVIVRKAGDVIPEVVGPVLSERPDGLPDRGGSPRAARCAAPTLVRPEGEADHRCVNPVCPASAWPAASATSPRGARWTSRASASSRCSCSRRSGCSQRRRPTSTPSTSTRLAELDGFGEISLNNLRAAIEASKARAARQPAGRARHQPPRPGRRPRCWPPSSATSTASWAAPVDELAATEGVGPVIARACTTWFAEPSNRDGHREAAGRRRQLPGPRGRRVGGQDPGRQVGRRDGHPRGLHPRGGRGRHQGAGRQVARQRVGQDAPPWWSGDEPGAAKVTKAESLGVPVLDEAGFEHLLDTGELPEPAESARRRSPHSGTVPQLSR